MAVVNGMLVKVHLPLVKSASGRTWASVESASPRKIVFVLVAVAELMTQLEMVTVKFSTSKEVAMYTSLTKSLKLLTPTYVSSVIKVKEYDVLPAEVSTEIHGTPTGVPSAIVSDQVVKEHLPLVEMASGRTWASVESASPR